MFIMRLLLAINPAVAQRLIQGFGVGDRFLAGVFFEDAQANAIRADMVFLQPDSECRGRLERQ